MKNQIKLFCIALAGAFMLTACGGPKLIGVTLPETPLVLATGETATAETSYTYDGETPENAQPEVVYTSGDAAIATVDENGVITGVAEGETTITATVGELSASRTVSVIIPVERLEAESMMLHLADGPASLTYTVVPENFTGELTFASANNAIVTVDANGQITPVGAGDTNVTVTAPNGMTATAQIRVWDGPKELNLAPAKTEVTKGSGTQIGVTDEQGNDVEAESLTWTSSDESIATVTEGWVDMVGTGDVKITAATQYGVSAAVDLTGKAPVAPTAPAASSAGAGGQTYGGGAAPAASSDGTLHTNWTLYADGTALDLMNGLRASVGATSLTWDDGLQAIAWERCKQLLADFSHNGAQTPENIAMGIGELGDAASVVAAWEASSVHYAAMVNTGFTRCAVVHIYDGDGCNFWCATFG